MTVQVDLLIKILISVCVLTTVCSNTVQSERSSAHLDVHTALKEFLINLNSTASFFQVDTESLQFNRRSFVEFEKNFTNITQECASQVDHLVEGLRKRSDWAITVIDSFGKPPSGILEGSLIWPGDFTECISVVESSIQWKSKYCSLQNTIAPNVTNPLVRNDQLTFKYGACLPMECTESDIASIFNQLLEHDSMNKRQLEMYNDIEFDSGDVICHYTKEFDSNSTIAIIVFGAFFLLVLIGTVFDLVKLYIRRIIFLRESRTITFQFTDDSINNEETQNLIADITEQSFFSDESIFSKLLSNFSIYSNSIKVFKDSTEASRLRCLHAIRVLSLSWIILAHTYGFIIMFADNLRETTQLVRRFSFSVITNGYFAVDNFFILSGLLTSYKFIKELRKPGSSFSLGFMLKYYLHRLWRIIPTYVSVMTMTVLLTKYLGDGPFFPLDGFEPQDNCQQNWWYNILFINNFLKQEDMCFSISWYLANDMQFHWVAPIILIPLAYRKNYLGTFIGVLFLIGNILAIVLILDANPLAELGNYGPNSEVFLDMIYNKPWARIGPFIIGLFLGWIILHQDQITIKPMFRILIWIFSLILGCLCVFGLYPDFKHFPEVYYQRGFHIFYQSTSRIVWSIGTACVIFACGISKGKLINKILTLRFWIPLSRLSYSAYLIHCSVIFYLYSTQDRAMHIQDINMIYFFLGNLMFSYIAAFFISTCVELPFIGLEKLILAKG